MRAEFKPSFKRDFKALEPTMRQRVSVFCLEIIPAAKSQKYLLDNQAAKCPQRLYWLLGYLGFNILFIFRIVQMKGFCI